LDNPIGVALHSSGNLYVADQGNNRVLFCPSGSTTATSVYGQSGSFASHTANDGGVSANSLSGPTGVVLDGGGNLYVADSGNNRVLFYPPAAPPPPRSRTRFRKSRFFAMMKCAPSYQSRLTETPDSLTI